MERIWRRRVRYALAGVVSTSVVLLTVAVVPVVVADAAIPLTPPDGGLVRLHLGPDSDYFRFDAPDGSGGYTAGTPAPITTRNCVATTSGVMTVTPIPSNAKVGLVADGLGVQSKGEGNGQPCGRADGPGQGLVVKLASTLSDKKIDYAELDVEGKFDIVVRADLYLAGSQVGTATQGFGTRSDSGPDSGDGDNERWRLAAPSGSVFDEIRFSVDPSTPAGGFSLEGGADGTVPVPGGLGAALATNDSLFHLTESFGTLDCNDPPVAIGGDDVPDAVLVRLSNKLGTDADCVKIPYSFTSSEDQIDLFKDVGDQAQYIPQFTLAIEWEPESAAYPVNRITSIDFHDGGGEHPVEWCNGTPSAPELPGDEIWCLVEQSTTIVDDGLIQVTESFYGAGDPTISRPR